MLSLWQIMTVYALFVTDNGGLCLWGSVLSYSSYCCNSCKYLHVAMSDYTHVAVVNQNAVFAHLASKYRLPIHLNSAEHHGTHSSQMTHTVTQWLITLWIMNQTTQIHVAQKIDMIAHSISDLQASYVSPLLVKRSASVVDVEPTCNKYMPSECLLSVWMYCVALFSQFNIVRINYIWQNWLI